MSEREEEAAAPAAPRSAEPPPLPAPYAALLAQFDAARAILDACEATTRALAAGQAAAAIRAQVRAPARPGSGMPATFGSAPAAPAAASIPDAEPAIARLSSAADFAAHPSSESEQ
jgi:hypothetical protein